MTFVYFTRWKCSTCDLLNETLSYKCVVYCAECKTKHTFFQPKCRTCEERIDCLILPKIIYVCFGWYEQLENSKGMSVPVFRELSTTTGVSFSGY